MAPADRVPDPLWRAHDRLASAIDRAAPDAGRPSASRRALLLCAVARHGAPDEPDDAIRTLATGSPFDDGGVEIPRSTGVVDALADVLDVADAPAEGDPIGALHEATLPAERRGALGQFYTPPRIAAAAARWAVGGRDAPRTLDPAAGSGAFLAAAADAGAGDLVAVDVERFPLRLAARRLDLAVHDDSFFALDPDDLGRFDAVVGNPPFVRAAAFDADRARACLPDGVAFSGRSDAYVYFVAHATAFLREGGRLAMVVPRKWLASDYGEAFARFLRERYAVRAVVGLDRAFDALVEPALLLAERRADPPDGRARFVRLDGPATPDAVLGAVETPVEGAIRSTDGGRVLPVDRSRLGEEPLERCLTAPADLLDLLAGPAFVPLERLADVSRGVMTGANDAFFLDADGRAARGIDGRFLAPALKSVRGLEARVLDADDLDRRLLDVHRYVERVAADGGDGSLEDRVKAALDREGHDGLLAHLDRAEAAGHHEGRTCRRRDVWFDLGALSAPDVILPKLLRERAFVAWNRAGAVPSNAIDCLAARDGVDPLALVGVLNSSFGAAAMEVRGRNEAGLLQLMTYETASLPVPDVRRLDGDARDRLRAATRAHVARDDAAGTPDRLDAAVIDAFDLEWSPDRIRDRRDRLRRRRLDGGG